MFDFNCGIVLFADASCMLAWIQVQAVLLLLGGREIPPGMSGANVSNHHHHKVGVLYVYLCCRFWCMISDVALNILVIYCQRTLIVRSFLWI